MRLLERSLVVRAEPGLDVAGDLRGHEVVGELGEHPGHVEGDVADAEHGDFLRLERPGARHVGVPVVPGDEVGRPVGALEVDAGNVEGGVPVRAGRDDDRVVGGGQLLDGHVRAHVDVPDEPDVPALEDLVQGHDDLLDSRVVRRHPVADEPVGGGQLLVQVDRDVELGLGQNIGCVDPGGAGANDGDGQRLGRHMHLTNVLIEPEQV